MIKATFKQKENDEIISFEMTGHADFAEMGSDIVCAAASSLSINAVNSIEELAGYQPIVDVSDGYLYLELLSEMSDVQRAVTDILLKSLLIGLRGIEEEYKEYMNAAHVDFKDHSKIIILLYDRFIAPNEEITSFLEDKNINWADDMHIANTMVINTLKSFTQYSNEETKLLKLLLDESHLDFTRELLRQTIRYEDNLTKIIDETASNWELERIALIDKIILQMALAEFLHFPSIPTKVTINEYVEIAKSYSTPNSQVFINGILDKALKDLTANGEIRKSARGLM